MKVLSQLRSSKVHPLIAAALVGVGVLGGGAVAVAATTSGPAIHTKTPRTDRDVTNLDVDRQQIKNYYGDPLGSGTASPTSNYAKQVGSVEAGASKYLARPYHGKKTKAILLDVDDTALLTWNYEIVSNFAYNPGTNTTYVTDQLFPPVFGMVALAQKAAQEGYAVFFLTGRGAVQEDATLGNLTADGVGVDAGYPTPTTLSDACSPSRQWPTTRTT